MPIRNKDYKAVIEVGNKNMDVILVPDEGDIIYPGESRVMDVFIHSRSLEVIRDLLSVGSHFKLREGGRIIGNGVVLEKDF